MSETTQAFEVLWLLNKRLIAPEMRDAINSTIGFWLPVKIGLESTLVLGIFALLDKNSSDSATLYALRKYLTGNLEAAFDATFWSELDQIRGRYKTARNKLFGHNDPDRADEVFAFASLGLTWGNVESDIATMSRAVRTLSKALSLDPVSARTEDQRNLAIVRTRHDTTSVLRTISALAK